MDFLFGRTGKRRNNKMKITWFKALGLIGLLASELTKVAEDGKITITEALTVVSKICLELGINFDTTGLTMEDLTKHLASLEKSDGEKIA